jgi:four helix bundle protein
MAFDVYDASISLLSTLAPLLARLRTADLELEDQARRAATSVSLNIAEANQRVGKDRRNRFRIGLGSTAEVAAALDVAFALGDLVERDVAMSRRRVR